MGPWVQGPGSSHGVHYTPESKIPGKLACILTQRDRAGERGDKARDGEMGGRGEKKRRRSTERDYVQMFGVYKPVICKPKYLQGYFLKVTPFLFSTSFAISVRM